jgi:hypothetical protein
MDQDIRMTAMCPVWHPKLRQPWRSGVACNRPAGHDGLHEGNHYTKQSASQDGTVGVALADVLVRW